MPTLELLIDTARLDAAGWIDYPDMVFASISFGRILKQRLSIAILEFRKGGKVPVKHSLSISSCTASRVIMSTLISACA